jgi:hypothetical protein
MIADGAMLKNGNTKSCGCWRREEARRRAEKPKPQPGDRFGRLTVIAFLGTQGRYPRVRCQCDCGHITEPHWYNLKSGGTLSCGCLHEEIISARFTTHGRSRTPEYFVWRLMKTRCLLASGKDFQRYGARGIRVCDRWRSSFANFLADMGPRPTPQHSIDRINNDGHYEPSNCRWATARTQRENQRRTRFYTFNGHTGTLKDLATRAGISYSMVHQRMKKPNWTIEEAMTTPAGQPRPHWDSRK